MALDYTGSLCLLNSARAELIIDVTDFDKTDIGQWTIKRERNGHRYAVRWINGSLVRLHRFLLDASPDLDVDHRDRNGLNNRRGNIRCCTRSQNNFNTRRRSDNSSGFKGVYRHYATGKKVWLARIKIAGRVFSLGLFETAEAAAEARNAAAVIHHGQYARAE